MRGLHRGRSTGVPRSWRQVGKALVEGVANAQDGGQLAPGPACPTCGEETHAESSKRKCVQTHLAEVEAERCHYYCPCCGRGLFPLDEQLQLWDGGWSQTLPE